MTSGFSKMQIMGDVTENSSDALTVRKAGCGHLQSRHRRRVGSESRNRGHERKEEAVSFYTTPTSTTVSLPVTPSVCGPDNSTLSSSTVRNVSFPWDLGWKERSTVSSAHHLESEICVILHPLYP